MSDFEINITGAMSLVSALLVLPAMTGMVMTYRYLNRPLRICFAILMCNVSMCFCYGMAFLNRDQTLIHIAYVINFFILTGYTLYITEIVRLRRRISYWPYFLSVLCCVISYLLLREGGYNIITGEYRSDYYSVAQLFAAGTVVIDMLLLTLNREYVERKEIFFLGVLPVLPTVLGELAKLFMPFRIRPILVTFSNLLFYDHLHVYDTRRLAAMREQLAHDRLAIAVNQIRPHFIFNALSAIYYLCDTDSERAKEAIQSFARYLRTNLEVVGGERVIPFDEELSHVRYYLDLERLRFGERIHVEWDINVRDFKLPVLSVQPLVENAVKHGLAPIPEGGSLTIASHETEYGFTVTVSNDGVPYSMELDEKDRIPVGTRSVRERVEMLCGGTLEVGTGKGGKGCVATIELPKSAKIDKSGFDPV